MKRLAATKLDASGSRDGEREAAGPQLAIGRTTPILLGLFTIVTLLAERMAEDGEVPINETAWYSKQEASFSDCLVMVRKRYLEITNFVESDCEAEVVQIPSKVFNHFVSCLAMAA